MTQKQTPFFLAGLLMLLIGQSSYSLKEQPPREPAGLIITARPVKIKYMGGSNVIFVTATLFNPTKDTIHFASMSCSYSDYFLTDKSAYSIQVNLCERNFPIVLSIPPGDSMNRTLLLKPWNLAVLKNVQSRIGMYLQILKKKEFINFEQYRKRKNAPVIWSDPIDFSRIERIPY